MNGSSFNFLWRQIIPESITNPQYRIEEDSFDYIVRHTMMRPRQIQIHLEHLAMEFIGQTIQDKFVPRAISESSKKVAGFYVQEYLTEYPNLTKFINSFHKTVNVMEYKEFRRYVENALVRFHNKNDNITVESKVDTLYAMGFFGVVNFPEAGEVLGDAYRPPTKESRPHWVDFFFKNPHPSISLTLCDESVVALHPIFVDYASLRAHPTLIIG